MTTTERPTWRLLQPVLARMMRCSRRADPASLSYTNDLGQRYTRGGRLNDGITLATAAWAEIMDREPTYTVRPTRTSRERVTVRPWRHGRADAWTYLKLTAQDRVFGGFARDLLARLERDGKTP